MSKVEYDLYIEIPKKNVHFLNYLFEAEDNLMNIRHIDPVTKLLKIVVIDSDLERVMSLLNSLKEDLQLKVVKYEPNSGIL